MPDAPFPLKSPGPQASGFFAFSGWRHRRSKQISKVHGLTPGSSWIFSSRNGGITITASQKIARLVGASSRAIQAAQPGTSAWNAEEQAIRESSSIPWYDIGALEAPATIASEHRLCFQDGMVNKATAKPLHWNTSDELLRATKHSMIRQRSSEKLKIKTGDRG